jgi:hypothetical protein
MGSGSGVGGLVAKAILLDEKTGANADFLQVIFDDGPQERTQSLHLALAFGFADFRADPAD